MDGLENNAVILSEGANISDIGPRLNKLLSNGWQLTPDKKGVTKCFYFPTYTKVMDFAFCIGIRSKRANHHSTLTMKSGSVEVTWTTHVPPGLSMKDTKMADYCDDVAKTTVISVHQTESLKCGTPSKA
ncbi:hypothetical protein FE257_003647 [Aspergillus nanangensis]|uniref:4a-hydroxytetrahydrobiopterin dehydratase n=1 Tax=Aspergillus nanangensis TaxID=2582783 RepID=A0AAD4CS89_ASPNN|nr:hypothetical protein FE257_003647 [Aspergillus nanangensis]